jgi:hypothetical protein
VKRFNGISNHAGFTVAERRKRGFWQPELDCFAGVVLMRLIQGEKFSLELGKAHFTDSRTRYPAELGNSPKIPY